MGLVMSFDFIGSTELFDTHVVVALVQLLTCVCDDMSFQMLMSLEELETLEALVSSIIDNTVGSQRKNFCQVIDYDVQVLGDIVDLYILVIVVVLYAIIYVNVTHCVCVCIWSISVIV